MEDLDYWRLCDELSLHQAAELIIGMKPGEVHEMFMLGRELTSTASVKYYTDMNAALSALGNSIGGKRLAGKIVYKDTNVEGGVSAAAADSIPGLIDWDKSTIMVADLKEWLWSRGVRTGFFFPDEETADYLNPRHPRYAPKLAAAVRAWQSVTDLNGKSPKQALSKWLRENAAEFGLTDDDGVPNETGIEEASKVANWQPSGGAPKTPSK